MQPLTVLAIAAHPDDIEFMMAGTLLLLRQAGCPIHCLNVASGSCGGTDYSRLQLRRLRRREAQAAARLLGAEWHAGFADDLEILYTLPLLRRVAAVVREVNPGIVLTHSPEDYMEDHTNTCRLAVTATFARGMPNFRTTPLRAPVAGDVTVYHAVPHGLRDPLRRSIIPGAYVNTTSVHRQKLAALAQHRTQQQWLDSSQKMNSYLQTMETFSRVLGRQSGQFRFAEGWRRRLHLGFGLAGADPIRDLLGRNYLVNRAYERALNPKS